MVETMHSAQVIVSDCQDLHTGGSGSPEYGMGMRRERRDSIEYRESEKNKGVGDRAG